MGVVVATVAILGVWGASKLASPQHQGVIEHAALLEVAQKTSNGTVHFTRILAVVAFQVAVLVPFVGVGALDEANTCFSKSAGHQALASKVVGLVVSHAVKVKRRLRLLTEVGDLWRFRLHSESQFERFDPAFQLRVVPDRPQPFLFDRLEVIQLGPLEIFRQPGGHVCKLGPRRGNGGVAHGDPVVGRGKKSAGPVHHPAVP